MNNTQNRSTTYLLPLITIPFEKYKNRFVNSYITDKSINIETEYHMIIQLNAGINDSLLLEKDVITIYRKNIANQLYDIVVVKIPEQFHKSFDKIILGNYSGITDEAKRRIVTFPLNKHNNVLTMVLNESDEWRNRIYEYLKSEKNLKSNEKLMKLLNEVDLDDMINTKDYLIETLE